MSRHAGSCSGKTGESRVVPPKRHDGFPVPGGQPRHERRGGSVRCLAKDPYPDESFRWGDMLRLRVGKYRIMYVVEGDLVTIQRVDRVSGA